jgi:CheY-like chemotaxis protein
MLDEDEVKPYSIEAGKYVKISVTDTGVGMDKSTLDRIFDPFFTTKEMGRGTGLGLASAYGIIKNHLGFINVSSEQGEGTTFNIYLPASEKAVVDEKRLSEKVLKGKETVLLVDDEDMILDVGKAMLEKMGYIILTAKGGKEAIESYKQNQDKIGIVILDMIMPDIGGGEAYDKLKAINPQIKVLLSSGYSIDGHATEILKRGCNGFIQKPFNIIDLSKKLREVLDQH